MGNAYPISPAQTSFINDLIAERDLSSRTPSLDTMLGEFELGSLRGKRIHECIDALKACPRKAVKTSRPTGFADKTQKLITEQGAYFLDGDYYVVKQGQAGHLYAKRLVAIRDSQGDRLNEDGDHVRYELEYAPGIVRKLRPEDRLDASAAKKFSLVSGCCVMCGIKLTVAESIERGYGRVCAKYFA